MSVYIKGMEMPTGCLDCDFRKHDLCKLWLRVWDCAFNRHKDCPLIPVPDHGRLVDADALWKEEKSADALHKLRPKGESVIYDAGFLAGYRAAAQIASRMPTIIPAEEDGK